MSEATTTTTTSKSGAFGTRRPLTVSGLLRALCSQTHRLGAVSEHDLWQDASAFAAQPIGVANEVQRGAGGLTRVNVAKSQMFLSKSSSCAWVPPVEGICSWVNAALACCSVISESLNFIALLEDGCGKVLGRSSHLPRDADSASGLGRRLAPAAVTEVLRWTSHGGGNQTLLVRLQSPN